MFEQVVTGLAQRTHASEDGQCLRRGGADHQPAPVGPGGAGKGKTGRGISWSVPTARGRTRTLIADSGLTKIKIAVDATGQEDYARYRKNGHLHKALDFTRKIVQYKGTAATGKSHGHLAVHSVQP